MKRPGKMPQTVGRRFEAELRAARRTGDPTVAWHALERAHVLSQPWAGPHLRAHCAMLRLGWAHRDVREVRGQLLRLAGAGPISLTGRFPSGNTGRARVPATARMPIEPELAALLESAGMHVTA